MKFIGIVIEKSKDGFVAFQTKPELTQAVYDKFTDGMPLLDTKKFKIDGDLLLVKIATAVISHRILQSNLQEAAEFISNVAAEKQRAKEAHAKQVEALAKEMGLPLID